MSIRVPRSKPLPSSQPVRAVSALRRALLAWPALLALRVWAAPEFPRFGDELYQPRLRQPGKDVMLLPTPEAMLRQVPQPAQTTAADLVSDLGPGAGRIATAGAKEFGARAVGIEYEPPMAALAERNAERAGVADKVRIIRG